MKNNEFCMSCTNDNGCTILTVKKCIGETCRFAQTKEQAKEAQRKSFEALSKLDDAKQRYIADKYYAGKMPWLKDGEKNGR
ncbi:MAG: hypothetical protein ACYCYM_14285 [Saccharofermentanales bacterium]